MPARLDCEPDSTFEPFLGGHPTGRRPYGPRMNTHRQAASPRAAVASGHARRGRRAHQHLVGLAAAAVATVAIVAAACSPSAATPLPIPSVALPSVDVSAAASAAAGAAMSALDQVDTAITANQTSAGLTADEASSLKQLTAAARTALQTGDTAAAKTAIDNLSTKVQGFAAKLNNATGQQLTTAIAALKAALPAS